jgi:hypothetical protein
MGCFTAPSKGLYEFTTTIQASVGNGATMIPYLYIGSGLASRTRARGASARVPTSIIFTWNVPLNAGQNVRFRYSGNTFGMYGNAGINSDYAPRLSGVKIN